MKVLFVNCDGGGFADHLDVPEGTAPFAPPRAIRNRIANAKSCRHATCVARVY